MKLIVPLLVVSATAALAGTVHRAVAAGPPTACAKNGQTLPAKATVDNTVLVKLWRYDSSGKLLVSGGGRLRLVRIGKTGKHIPVNGFARPGCWVLISHLPNFTHRPLRLCLVVRGHMQAIHDPEHLDQPAACPAPVLDGSSGLYTYRFFVQDLA